jgi:hypothetical protein
MKSKVKILHLSLLSIPCAVCIALVPVIPQLHQAFANHKHIYCLQHHQVEDAGPKQNGFAFSNGALSAEAAVKPGTENATVDGNLHPACLFSNLAVHSFLPKAAKLCAPSPFKTQSPKVLTDVRVAVSRIILFAPKHSPPISA